MNQPLLLSLQISGRLLQSLAPAAAHLAEVDLPLSPGRLQYQRFQLTISLGKFGATSFLTRPEMPTIPVAIYRYLSQPGAANYGQAMAMATILMLVCALAVLLIELLDSSALLRN